MRTYSEKRDAAILAAGRDQASQYPRCHAVASSGAFPCGAVCGCYTTAKRAVEAFEAELARLTKTA